MVNIKDLPPEVQKQLAALGKRVGAIVPKRTWLPLAPRPIRRRPYRKLLKMGVSRGAMGVAIYYQTNKWKAEA